jgi:restriction system protein
MYQSGSRTEWDWWQDAQRQEERRQEEKARRAEEHLTVQRRKAAEMTAALDRQVRILDGLLTDSLSAPPLTFRQLKITVQLPRFEPGQLGTASPEPEWSQFAPVRPSSMSRLVGGKARYEREMRQAERSFAASRTFHRCQEEKRRQALAAARARYECEIANAQAKFTPHNIDIDARQAALASGDPGTVEWFVGRLLDSSWYPSSFPRQHHVRYRPEKRDLTVEFELPPPEVIPEEREYRYREERDEIESLPRSGSEIRQRYARLISRVALRTLHEVFTATPADAVTAVLFNGRVSGSDMATGRPARPHLISVRADRLAFMEVELARVDATACLKKHLNGRVSPGPFDMEGVEPVTGFRP